MIETIEKEAEVINFVWENYSYLSRNYKKEQLENLFLSYKENIVTVSEYGTIKGMGFYLRLSDETFKDIVDRKIDLKNPSSVNNCLREDGNNIHFILLVAKGLKIIRLGLKEVIQKENPKTISWFSPDTKQFFLTKVR